MNLNEESRDGGLVIVIDVTFESVFTCNQPMPYIQVETPKILMRNGTFLHLCELK